MQLSWQPGYSLSKKPRKRPTARRTKREASGNADRPQQFEFVAEHPVRNHGARWYSSVTTSTRSEAPVEHTTDCQTSSEPTGTSLTLTDVSNKKHVVVSDDHGPRSHVQDVEKSGAFVKTPLLASNDTSLIRSDGVSSSETIYEFHSYPCNSEDDYASLRSPRSTTDRQLQILEWSDTCLITSYEQSSRVAAIGPSPAASDFLNMSRSSPGFIAPSILYNSISHRFRPILDRYNREFCKIPLTTDLQMNPFRYRADLDPEPIFLVHAVMALAGHHVESTSTQTHRHTALQLLRKSIDTYNIARDGYSMLDTIIILFTLDETKSALGNWNIHLMGAYSLLEACGSIEGWATSDRVVAQVGMLTWWDAITSLVSREDCVFPFAYFEAVLSNHTGRQWDFFGLCGCPPSLVKLVMQLARLSAEKRKSSSMRYVTFDNTAISEIEQSLESWHHVSPATAFRDEESMQQDQDGMHCSEAWRNGLLLYIYRVFHWKLGSDIPIRILYRARVILDHVFACRDESMVCRQALLPLFFAGCELRDRSSREKIVEFCSVWDERTRYHVFSSAVPLLEEVWAEQEMKGFENVWWGQVVDRQHASDSCSPLQMRLCFG